MQTLFPTANIFSLLRENINAQLFQKICRLEQCCKRHGHNQNLKIFQKLQTPLVLINEHFCYDPVFDRDFLNSIVDRLSHIWISRVCTTICSIIRSMYPSKVRVCQPYVQKYWGFRSPRFVSFSQVIHSTSAFDKLLWLCLFELLCAILCFR